MLEQTGRETTHSNSATVRMSNHVAVFKLNTQVERYHNNSNSNILRIVARIEKIKEEKMQVEAHRGRVRHRGRLQRTGGSITKESFK